MILTTRFSIGDRVRTSTDVGTVEGVSVIVMSTTEITYSVAWDNRDVKSYSIAEDLLEAAVAQESK